MGRNPLGRVSTIEAVHPLHISLTSDTGELAGQDILILGRETHVLMEMTGSDKQLTRSRSTRTDAGVTLRGIRQE